MAIPAALKRGLRVPVIAAPMFLVSSVDLVIETCKAGAIGSFPALNPRSTAELDEWLDAIGAGCGADAAAYAVNLIVGKRNPRLHADLAVIVRHRVPLVITSLGSDPAVVAAVHAYGGLVFHDIASLRHLQKAAEAGVDGLILLTGGAGGHTGFLNPFAFLAEARRHYEGTLLLAGGLSTGRDVAAAIVAGADFAYMGTRFIATQEANVPTGYREMILAGSCGDVLVTAGISGNPASFLKQSLQAAGLDLGVMLAAKEKVDHLIDGRPIQAWKDAWSAGQGIAAIDDTPPAGLLVDRLARDYAEALSIAPGLVTAFAR